MLVEQIVYLPEKKKKEKNNIIMQWNLDDGLVYIRLNMVPNSFPVSYTYTRESATKKSKQ